MNKAVFLDRDGVINLKRDDYIKSVEEVVILEGVPKAIRHLNQNNYLVIVITNQSAVNRGLLTQDELARIHGFIKKEIGKEGALIDAIYYCPHKPDENCTCRKPQTELIEKAISEHSISIDASCLIGDAESDIEAAKKLGIRAIRIEENGSLLEAVYNALRSR